MMPTTECEAIEPLAAKCAAGLSTTPVKGELPFVTVIMPVRNEERYIGRSLGAVLAQDYPRDRMEIIVADGQSTDATAEIVRSLQTDWPNLRLIDNAGRIVPTGMNAAIRLARGEIIVRVDGHCEVAADYVRRCVEHIQHDGVDAVGGPVETVGESFVSQAIAVALSSPFGVGGTSFRTVKNRPMLIETVPFPAYTRQAIIRTGLFDEQLVRGQDCEYNHRLVKLGGTILLTPDVRSKYYSRSCLRSLCRQYCRSGYWKFRVAQKHPRQVRIRQFAPAALLVVLAVLAAWGAWSEAARLGLYAVAGSYICVNLLGSLLTVRTRGAKYLPLLPIVFCAVHFSYAIGFSFAVLRFSGQWRDRIGGIPSWTAGGLR